MYWQWKMSGASAHGFRSGAFLSLDPGKKSWIRNTGSTATFYWGAGNWMEFRYLQYLAGWGRGLVLSTSHSCFWKSVWPNILHSSGIPRLFFGWRKKQYFSPRKFLFRITIFRFSIQNISSGPETPPRNLFETNLSVLTKKRRIQIHKLKIKL